MGISDIAVQPVDEGNSESTIRFLIEWVSDGEAEARSYLADHAEPDGASLIATDGPDVIGYVAIVWESNYAGFRSRGIPPVHQIAVAGPFLRQGVFQLNPCERSFFSGLAGAGQCQTGSPCDLSGAITVDDHARTVTFHLTAPDGNFLNKLAFASMPVPASVPAHEVGTTPVPATGPYMITRYVSGREIDLARNPYFRQWSQAAQPDGFPDRIVWRFGLTPAQEVAAIEAGRADWMADPPPDYQDRTTRYDRQVHLNPVPGIAHVAFNVTVPPFNDLRVRQAVSLAADRNQAVVALSGPDPAQPTCQIIPPGLPGHRPYCPFTVDPSASGGWVGPDLAQARSLVAASRTEGMRVVVWAYQWDGRLGPYTVSVLNELGYRTSLRVASVSAFASNRSARPGRRRRPARRSCREACEPPVPGYLPGRSTTGGWLSLA
jgi:ABC-type transport system substrate-binding protein